MQLNRKSLATINRLAYNNPIQDNTLPIRVLQFGTGVLLRGLTAFCIDQANKQGLFHGGIVMVKSTTTGSIQSFKEQDCLYTVHTRGVQNNEIIEKQQIITSIQHVLDANTSWLAVLELAKEPQINIIISNITEKGIVEQKDNTQAMPPKSYPGKITAYLYKRFQELGTTDASRIIILPTELTDNNASCLKEIVLQQVKQNNLDSAFIEWLDRYAYFCNTLVDRIVPGSYTPANSAYTDRLSIAVEPYSLWAIESSDPYVLEELDFLKQSSLISILPSIAAIKEIKIRVLNATHTLITAVALLANHRFVKDTFMDKSFEKFLLQLLDEEIIPCLEQQGIAERQINQFAKELINRFKNPFIEHQWLSIAQNYQAKLKSRVLPLLVYWYSFQSVAPNYISFGLAAYLYLLRKGSTHIEPEIALILKNSESIDFQLLLSNESLWGIDLTQYKGLTRAIQQHWTRLEQASLTHIIETI